MRRLQRCARCCSNEAEFLHVPRQVFRRAPHRRRAVARARLLAAEVIRVAAAAAVREGKAGAGVDAEVPATALAVTLAPHGGQPAGL